jgi:hypothetical protein
MDISSITSGQDEKLTEFKSETQEKLGALETLLNQRTSDLETLVDEDLSTKMAEQVKELVEGQQKLETELKSVSMSLK